jgi:Leucine-rich repeat (LRR) protein
MYMRNRLENQNDLELVIENAIEARILELNLSSYTEYIIPKSIGSISNLEELNIYSESLRPIYIEELPESIGNLHNLKILYVCDCQLEYLPESIGNLENLEELVLIDLRRLKEIPNSIGNLKKLELRGCVSGM